MPDTWFHAYWRVDPDILWDSVVLDLPPLIRDLSAALDSPLES